MDASDIIKIEGDGAVQAVKEIFGDSFLEVFNHPRVMLTADCRAFVKLKNPVLDIGTGEKTSIVEVREPTVKDYRKAAKLDKVDASVALIANMIGTTDSQVDNMSESEFILLNEVMSAFLSTGR